MQQSPLKVSCHNSTAVEKSRIKNHLEALEVKSRMQEYCLNEFKELRRKAKKYHFDLDQWISSKISIIEINGSDWCTAFYESLHHCDDAKQFLNRLMPIPQSDENLLEEEDTDCFDFN